MTTAAFSRFLTKTRRSHSLRQHALIVRCFAAALTLGTSGVAANASELAEASVSYPMLSNSWTMAPSLGWAGHTVGSAQFARYEGMPTGTMALNEGVAVSNTARFATGSIDFDMKPNGYNDAGILLHRTPDDDGEFVYLRANPDCPAANDCIQYAPVTHGLMQWDIYPNFQRGAPISPAGWNHVRIDVSATSMLVFVNHSTEPTLVIPRLRGISRDGGIAFKGPATFANLSISVGNRFPIEVAAEHAAPGTITSWQAAPPTTWNRAHTIAAADIPRQQAWTPVEVEPTGLVNLSKLFGRAHAPELSTGWLKATIRASGEETKVLHIGFARQATLFLNGVAIFSGDNPYYPQEARISPDGRMDHDNASVTLHLRKGSNELVLAVGNDWASHGKAPKPSSYGWGAEAFFDDPGGLVVE